MKNKESKHLEGVLKRYTTNKHNDINGFVITNDTGDTDLKFPPHTAKYIMQQLKEGYFVKITFTEEDGHQPKDHKVHPPVKQLQTFIDQSSGTEFNVADHPAPKPADSDDQFEFTINNPQLLRGKKDEIIAIQFEDKLLHIKPHVADILKANPSQTVNVKAKKRIGDSGFVNRDNLTVYHVTEVTLGMEPAFA